jgi:hypothetical protein
VNPRAGVFVVMDASQTKSPFDIRRTGWARRTSNPVLLREPRFSGIC